MPTFSIHHYLLFRIIPYMVTVFLSDKLKNYFLNPLSTIGGTRIPLHQVKNLLVNAGDMRCGFDPWDRKIPWKRNGQLTPVFLPEESIPWTEDPGGL